MSLSDKIEGIRQKPEHIRMRYVWFFVTLSMLFVIILWVFSLKTLKPESQSAPTENDFSGSNIIKEFNQEQQKLDDARKNAESALSDNNAAPDSEIQKDEAQDNQTQKNLNDEKGQ